VSTFESTLEDWKLRRGRIEIRIQAEQFELWLGFVNDMRLLLGTELDIRDDGWSLRDIDPLHPQAQDFFLLHYLSWLEQELLEADQ
jgi:hypothetical protein